MYRFSFKKRISSIKIGPMPSLRWVTRQSNFDQRLYTIAACERKWSTLQHSLEKTSNSFWASSIVLSSSDPMLKSFESEGSSSHSSLVSFATILNYPSWHEGVFCFNIRLHIVFSRAFMVFSFFCLDFVEFRAEWLVSFIMLTKGIRQKS